MESEVSTSTFLDAVHVMPNPGFFYPQFSSKIIEVSAPARYSYLGCDGVTNAAVQLLDVHGFAPDSVSFPPTIMVASSLISDTNA